MMLEDLAKRLCHLNPGKHGYNGTSSRVRFPDPSFRLDLATKQREALGTSGPDLHFHSLSSHPPFPF